MIPWVRRHYEAGPSVVDNFCVSKPRWNVEGRHYGAPSLAAQKAVFLRQSKTTKICIFFEGVKITSGKVLCLHSVMNLDAKTDGFVQSMQLAGSYKSW